MKKTIFILMSFSLFPFIYGQNSINLQIQELQKFANNKEQVYHLINEQNKNLLIIYRNGVLANISFLQKENEESAYNELKVTYFISGKDLIKKRDDKKGISKFVKTELDKNDFLLKDFIDEAYDNALVGVEKSAVELPNGFTVYAVNKDMESELIIKVIEIQEDQFVVSILYGLTL